MERNARAHADSAHRTGRWGGTYTVALLLVALASARAGGQTPAATPPVPPGHWAYRALDRMAAAGLIDDEWAVGHRPQSAGVMMAALRAAQASAVEEASPLADFVRSSARRFAREFPPSHDARGGSHVSVREATFRASGTTGGAPGFGTIEIGADVTAALGRHFALKIGRAHV